MSENVIAALRTVLLDDGAVATLVGTRVFGVELPRAEATSMPRPCVVLRPSGGATFMPGSFVEHDAQRIDAMCYGETPFEAERVRIAVSDAFRTLRRGRVGTTLIHWVSPAGGMLTNRDTDAEWPLAFQSFQALYALEAA